MATKQDPDPMRPEMQVLGSELRTEIHRTGRDLTLSLTSIVAVLNAITSTAPKVCG